MNCKAWRQSRRSLDDLRGNSSLVEHRVRLPGHLTRGGLRRSNCCCCGRYRDCKSAGSLCCHLRRGHRQAMVHAHEPCPFLWCDADRLASRLLLRLLGPRLTSLLLKPRLLLAPRRPLLVRRPLLRGRLAEVDDRHPLEGEGSRHAACRVRRCHRCARYTDWHGRGWWRARGRSICALEVAPHDGLRPAPGRFPAGPAWNLPCRLSLTTCWVIRRASRAGTRRRRRHECRIVMYWCVQLLPCAYSSACCRCGVMHLSGHRASARRTN